MKKILAVAALLLTPLCWGEHVRQGVHRARIESPWASEVLNSTCLNGTSLKALNLLFSKLTKKQKQKLFEAKGHAISEMLAAENKETGEKRFYYVVSDSAEGSSTIVLSEDGKTIQVAGTGDFSKIR